MSVADWQAGKTNERHRRVLAKGPGKWVGQKFGLHHHHHQPHLQSHWHLLCSAVLFLFMALFALLFMGVHFKRYEHLLRHHVWLLLCDPECASACMTVP